MEYAKVSEFPQYSDGDVSIIVAPLKTYQLHSNVLRTQSHYFADVLNADQAAFLSTKARKEGVTTRYRFQLVKEQFGAIGTFQSLVSLQLSPHNLIPTDFFPSTSTAWVAHLQVASR